LLADTSVYTESGFPSNHPNESNECRSYIVWTWDAVEAEKLNPQWIMTGSEKLLLTLLLWA